MAYERGYFVDCDGFYDNKCAMCNRYTLDNLSSAYNDGYKCTKHTLKRLAFDDKCSSFSKATGRTHKDIKRAFEKMESKYGKYRPHNYYIMTAICEILGIEEHDYFLAIGEFFREEVLHKDLRYVNFLVTYDIFGRLIANSIRKDEQRELVAYELFYSYLDPFCDCVILKDYESALRIYVEMFEKLKDLYQITDVTSYDFDNPYQLNDKEICRIRNSVNK